MMMNIGL